MLESSNSCKKAHAAEGLLLSPNTPPSFFSFADIVMEDVPTTPPLAPPATTLNGPAGSPAPPTNSAVISPPPPPAAALPAPQASAQTERDSRRSGSVGGRMGLTKEVLSAHTQQEEQAFLDRFKDLSKLRVFDQTTSSAPRWQPPSANPLSRGECWPSRTLKIQDKR